MPGFLASVADLDEAGLALAAGADILDLKDPARGALGAWAPDKLTTAVQRFRGRRPLSATTGDLPMMPTVLVEAAEATAATGVDYVKVGFFAGGSPEACIEALAVLARRTKLVAVLMADQAPGLQLIEPLAAAGFAGVMLDTADKRGGSLLNHQSLDELTRFVAAARARGLLTGLAGSLAVDDIRPLAALRPDFLGFRGALCDRGRAGPLSAAACRRVRQALDACASSATETAGAQVASSAFA